MYRKEENSWKADILGTEPIGKLIWKMSIPSVIGILSYNLYNIVDTIYISRGIGAFAAGGLAVTFPLFIFLSALSSTMGAGAASIISRALGKNDIRKANKTAGNTIGFFWIVALLITIAGLVFLDQLLYGMGVTKELMPYAKPYTRIILMGAITSTGFSSLARAEGNSRYAMYQWVFPIIINIILDPIFIFALHQGIQGAAIATVISQSISVFMCIYYFFISGKSKLQIRMTDMIPDRKIISEIITIGLPSFIQMAGHGLTIVIINNALRHYGGSLTISTYGIVNKISAFILIPLQGIVQGIQPLIGFNYGAGKASRVNETLKKSSGIAAIYGIFFSMILLVMADKFIYIFSGDTNIIQTGSNILKITCLGMAFTGINMIQTAYFQAIGKTGTSLILSLCNYIFCFIPVMLLLSLFYGLPGIWFSFPISAIITLGISSFCIRYQRSKLSC